MPVEIDELVLDVSQDPTRTPPTVAQPTPPDRASQSARATRERPVVEEVLSDLFQQLRRELP